MTGASLSKACSNLYHVWPGNYVDLYAWYQVRSIKYCRASKWVGGFVSHTLSLLSMRQANSMHTLHIMITQRSNCIFQLI